MAGGFQLRFIEQMPLGPRHSWAREELVSATEIRSLLSSEFTLRAAGRDSVAAPAAVWEVAERGGDLRGTVGIIASVTESFCAACDRTRLTSDGAVRACLFAHTETSLRDPLRAGASDAEIASIWAGAMAGKPARHGIGDAGFEQPSRTMSAIGG